MSFIGGRVLAAAIAVVALVAPATAAAEGPETHTLRVKVAGHHSRSIKTDWIVPGKGDLVIDTLVAGQPMFTDTVDNHHVYGYFLGVVAEIRSFSYDAPLRVRVTNTDAQPRTFTLRTTYLPALGKA